MLRREVHGQGPYPPGADQRPDLPGGLPQHPQVDAFHAALGLGHRDELVRLDQAVAGVLPAHQGLDPRHLARPAERHDRLEHHRQLAALGRARQVVLQVLQERLPGTHPGFEDAHAAAPAALAGVHRHVGLVEEVSQLAPGGPGVGDADAQAHLHGPPAQREGPQQLGHQRFGQLPRLRGRHPAEQHHELVAAQAAQRRAGRQAPAQASGELLQQQVAAPVPETVVDALEVVEVHHQQGQQRQAVLGLVRPGTSVCRPPGAPFGKPLLELGAVGQTGEGVVHGRVAQVVVDGLQLGRAFAYPRLQLGRVLQEPAFQDAALGHVGREAHRTDHLAAAPEGLLAHAQAHGPARQHEVDLADRRPAGAQGLVVEPLDQGHELGRKHLRAVLPGQVVAVGGAVGIAVQGGVVQDEPPLQVLDGDAHHALLAQPAQQVGLFERARVAGGLGGHVADQAHQAGGPAQVHLGRGTEAAEMAPALLAGRVGQGVFHIEAAPLLHDLPQRGVEQRAVLSRQARPQHPGVPLAQMGVVDIQHDPGLADLGVPEQHAAFTQKIQHLLKTQLQVSTQVGAGHLRPHGSDRLLGGAIPGRAGGWAAVPTGYCPARVGAAQTALDRAQANSPSRRRGSKFAVWRTL
ncbi:hypothetical protein DGo_CA2444 [Deinococcus gobiensis I-0]|uniref:Uncharacterized protein n=1 Tax=Deinococcus gobiensis (strain DSM 21396 / JCM 16679 / CGMCC 1.7299 / I-0) TaxID=745776 RepID=H8GRY0_DEIGI|nr:hypothetical protein DGo_CA2444 [Deinococcus gobiensis I-0]